VKRPPTTLELAFIFTGQPAPSGAWTGPLGRWLCSALGHAVPYDGAAYAYEPAPESILHRFSWGCPRCGCRFSHVIRTPRQASNDDEAAYLDALVTRTKRQLYLDVLYETNLGRRRALRWPVRDLPGLDSPISAPISPGPSIPAAYHASPPAN